MDAVEQLQELIRSRPLPDDALARFDELAESLSDDDKRFILPDLASAMYLAMQAEGRAVS